MKRVYVLLLGVSLLASVSLGAQLTFNNTASFDYVEGTGAPNGPAVAGWMAGAYVEDGTTAGFTWGEDSFYSSVALQMGPAGLVYYQGGAPDSLSIGDDVYVVFFNQTSIPGVSDTFYYSVAALGAHEMTLPVETVDFGGDTSWVMVPEPASFALFALGLGVVVLGRRLRRRR